jgi:hypothetical protein
MFQRRFAPVELPREKKILISLFSLKFSALDMDRD